MALNDIYIYIDAYCDHWKSTPTTNRFRCACRILRLEKKAGDGHPQPAQVCARGMNNDNIIGALHSDGRRRLREAKQRSMKYEADPDELLMSVLGTQMTLPFLTCVPAFVRRALGCCRCIKLRGSLP